MAFVVGLLFKAVALSCVDLLYRPSGRGGRIGNYANSPQGKDTIDLRTAASRAKPAIIVGDQYNVHAPSTINVDNSRKRPSSENLTGPQEGAAEGDLLDGVQTHSEPSSEDNGNMTD